MGLDFLPEPGSLMAHSSLRVETTFPSSEPYTEPWFPAWPPSVGSHDVLDSVGLNADQPLLHTQQRGLPFLHAGHTACLWEGDRGNGWPLRKCAHTHGKMQILKLGNSSTLRAQRQSGRSKLEGLGAESGGAITGVIEDRLCLI